MSYRRRKVRAGFSLVELMVVIVIIGLLAGAVTIGVRGYLARGRQARVKMDLAKIEEAIESYYAFNSRYPSTDEGIDVLSQPSSDGNERILKSIPKDPWGRPYEYVNPGPEGEPFEVVCYGADGREGGNGDDADLSNLDLRE